MGNELIGQNFNYMLEPPDTGFPQKSQKKVP